MNVRTQNTSKIWTMSVLEYQQFTKEKVFDAFSSLQNRPFERNISLTYERYLNVSVSNDTCKKNSWSDCSFFKSLSEFSIRSSHQKRRTMPESLSKSLKIAGTRSQESCWIRLLFNFFFNQRPLRNQFNHLVKCNYDSTLQSVHDSS